MNPELSLNDRFQASNNGTHQDGQHKETSHSALRPRQKRCLLDGHVIKQEEVLNGQERGEAGSKRNKLKSNSFRKKKPSGALVPMLPPVGYLVHEDDGQTPLHRCCDPASALAACAIPLPTYRLPDKEDSFHKLNGVSRIEQSEEDSCTVVHPPKRARPSPKQDASAALAGGTAFLAQVNSLRWAQWTLQTTCLLLHNKDVRMACVQDLWGETPLHLLARRTPGMTEAEEKLRILSASAIVQASASATEGASGAHVVLSKDRVGNTPLHRSILSSICRRGAAPCAHQTNNTEQQHLHFRNKFDALLISSCPSVLASTNSAGLTPLATACRHRCSSSAAGGVTSALDIIVHMAQTFPDAMAMVDKEMGYSPLHFICDNDISAPLLLALLSIEESTGRKTQNKTAMLIQNRRGFTPLHLAALDRASLPVLTAMVQHCPRATIVRDHDGRTPLRLLWDAHMHATSVLRRHLKASVNRNDFKLEGIYWEFWEKILVLVRAEIHAESSLIEKDLVPNLAVEGSELHQICSRSDLPPLMFQVALRLYPHQVFQLNQEREFPLHCLFRDSSLLPFHSSRSDVSVISAEAVLQFAQESLEGGWNDDRIPGNFAVAHEAALHEGEDEEEEEFAVDEDNSSIASALSDGEEESEEAHDIAAMTEASSFQIFLDRANGASSSIGASSSTDSLPSYVSSSPSESLSYQSTGPKSTLTLLLDANPHAVSVPNKEGRLPLHLALDAGVMWGDGVNSIVEANPGALDIPDPRTGMLPFMLAAATPAKAEPEKTNRKFGLDDENGNTLSSSKFLNPVLPCSDHDMIKLNTIFILLSCKPDVLCSSGLIG